jgi:ADP-dependent NAD(P)H-hydrate dehydratase / NAD(P)H-hydrate epimerase
MKIVSAAEMREIDRATSERFGVPSLTLMENAGSAITRFILSDYPEARSISVICGKGNNGGDGFVVARQVAESGRVVRVLLLCGPEELRGDAAAMFEKLTILPLVVREVSALDSSDAAPIFAADLMVDAVLGTGFRPPVSALYAAAIGRTNESRAPVIAVDIPSGAEADAMQAPAGTVARADAVVTFTAPRPGHVFAGLTAGPTVIAPIGSPPDAIASNLGLHLNTPADFAQLLVPRVRDANKGSYGHVLVIGGSRGKAGAAAMAGFAALRAGAGLATIATPKSVLATVAGFHPEVMTEPLPETEEGTISLSALEAGLDAFRERKTVIAIGPGISRNPETAMFVRATLQPGIVGADVPFVLDADALNAFAGEAGEPNGRERTVVITPHPGEMARLTGLTIAEIQAKRLDVARRFAREHELIVVLKGHRTLIASPDGEVWVNPTGNPGMASGGTGDVLTGMVAGLIAQHPERVLEATALAVYLHGLAGDLASEEVGETCLVATDLVRFLPSAFARVRAAEDTDVRIHA